MAVKGHARSRVIRFAARSPKRAQFTLPNSLGITVYGLLSVAPALVGAVLPTAGLRMSDGQSTYASPAWFGLPLPEEKDASYTPIRVPKSSQYGCDGKVEVEDVPEEGGFLLLLERGHCTFDVKAVAAQEAGAEGVIVMNTLEGIYQVCNGARCTKSLLIFRTVLFLSRLVCEALLWFGRDRILAANSSGRWRESSSPLFTSGI